MRCAFSDCLYLRRFVGAVGEDVSLGLGWAEPRMVGWWGKGGKVTSKDKLGGVAA